VLAWFNNALSARLFPTLASLFPDLLPGSDTLRAHSVAVLKYNTSHPRTDVHVDDALFAFTIALSPAEAFEGGGTYFEHLDQVVEMPQGHATFRPGAVRHGGHPVTSGVRYVIGGFIAAADRVEHVRRLNERGNRILMGSSPTAIEMEHAARLFSYALVLNPHCSLCYQNLGDVHLQLDEPAKAEQSLRRQIELLPRDADAHYALGNALRRLERTSEARVAYEEALTYSPSDVESQLGLASSLGALGERDAEVRAYRAALQLRPADSAIWISLGIALSDFDDDAETEAAFRSAVAADPNDGRAPLNLGRYLAKLGRPAEAIDAFYAAAATDAEYFKEMKLGVGTARAQQGRLREAISAFTSASRMSPSDEKLASALVEMEKHARLVEASAHAFEEDAVADLCGSSCQDVVDGSGISVCAISWADGCGEATPPNGFHSDTTVSELCSHACLAYLVDQKPPAAA